MRSLDDAKDSGSLYTRAFLAGFAYHFVMALHFTNNALYPVYVRAEGGGVTAVGLFMGVYALAAVAGRPLVGWLIDRSGPVTVLVTGSLCISLPPFVYIALQGSGLNALVWVMRAVQGFGYGAHFSAAFTLAARIAPAHRRNEAIAMYGISGLAGASVGPYIGETIIRTYGLGTFFVSMGCLGVVAVLLVTRVRLERLDSRAPTLRAIASAFRTPRVGFAALLAFLLALCSSAPQSFLAVVAGARGIERFSLYFTAWGISGVLVRIVGGRWGDRAGVRRVLVPAYLFYGAGLAVLSAADHVLWVAAAGLLSGTAHGLAFPAVTTFGYLLVPHEVSGSAVALITGMMDMGAAFMAMGVGAVAGVFHHDVVFPIASAAAWTASLLVAVDIRRHPQALSSLEGDEDISIPTTTERKVIDMRKRVALCIILCAVPLAAQEKPPAEAERGWKNTLITGVNLTQVSLHNWMQGGESTIAWALFTTGKFAYSAERYLWTNGLKATYGQAKVGDRDVEKTDDELFFESILAYRLGWPVYPYVSVSLRTQCAPGYKNIGGERTQTSGFFDPGYIIESAGFAYQPSEYFTTRLGAAVKETFTSSFTQFGYTGDPAKKTRVQSGIESGTSAKYPVMENIVYTSQLNLFSAFEHLDVWDVRWDNTLSAKVNAYVNVSLNVLLVHEIAQTRRTQLKEALALGLTYTIL